MSDFIYSMHGECPKSVLTKGWIVETYELGRDPNNQSGADLSGWEGTIARLNHGYNPNGTIPLPEFYQDFAIRCSNFISNTTGCNHFIIGNEPNMQVEWPEGQRIHAEEYVECYNLCYQKSKEAVPSAHIIPAPIAPWNVQSGDWLDYFEYVLNNIIDCEGLCIHTYTHGADPSLIFSEQKMDAPYQDRHYHFRAYRDFIERIPARFATTPIYITETNQNDPWLNVNQGWVRNAYQEINDWNQSHAQKIKCLSLYRWQYDQWEIKGRDNVILDFLAAQERNYTTGEGGMQEIFRDGFEGTFYFADDPYSGESNVSELECPTGWTPDWVQGTVPGENHRPEYKPKIVPQPEVYQGQKAVGIHTTSSSHDGVLYQQFTVPQGANVKASAWAMGKGEGGHGMVVGIDPLGGTDFNSQTVKWGEWWSTDSPDWIEASWANILCEVLSQSSRITVFLRTTARYANSNAGHFDEFVLETEGEAPPPPSGGGIQFYIDALQRDLDALQGYVNENSITALPV